VLEVLWLAAKKAALFAMAFGLIFLASAVDNRWFADLARALGGGGIVTSPVLSLVYVFGGVAAGFYLGATKAIAEKIDALAQLVSQAGRSFLDRPGHRARLEQESIALAELQTFFRRKTSAIGVSAEPIRPETLQALTPMAEWLRPASMRSLRGLVESVLKDFEVRGMQQVNALHFLETVLEGLPSYLSNQVQLKEKVWRRAAYAVAGAWFAFPMLLAYILRR
jgi:hypothetical protein